MIVSVSFGTFWKYDCVLFIFFLFVLFEWLISYWGADLIIGNTNGTIE